MKIMSAGSLEELRWPRAPSLTLINVKRNNNKKTILLLFPIINPRVTYLVRRLSPGRRP